MLLTDAEIDEFIKHHRAAFNEELSRDEAREVANNFLELYQLLLRPTPREQDEKEEHEKEGGLSPPPV